MAKSGSNHGSIKRLNWQEPKFHEKVTKSVPHEEVSAATRRCGTPITRRGSYNGNVPSLRPSIDFSDGPDLFLNKAVLRPTKYGPGGAQFQRKRDSSGKFATAQQTGSESTAEEDQVDQQRDAKLRRHRIIDRLHGGKGEEEESKKALPPGTSGVDQPMTNINDTNSEVIGQTTSGQPVFEDPYHSSHANFTEADHNEAADLHYGMARQSQQAGDVAGAMKHSTAGGAHKESASQAMTPGSRFADNALADPEMDTDQFMDLLGVDQGMSPSIPGSTPMAEMPDMNNPSAPGAQNMPPEVRGGDDLDTFLDQPPVPDQNKPLPGTDLAGPAPGMYNTHTGTGIGPQTEVESAAGPYPMAGEQDPMAMAPPQQDPMAMAPPQQDPMMPPPQEDPMASFMGQEEPMEAPPQENQVPDIMGVDETAAASNGFPEPAPQDMAPEADAAEMDVPETNAGFPGPTTASNEEDEEKKKEATFKAISMLKRYL